MINHNQPIQSPQRINPYLYVLSFPYTCIICRRGPIYHAIYFCRECNMIICPQCEFTEGKTHLHPLYKAQNAAQFEGLNINNVSNIEKFMEGVGNKVEDAYNSVVGFFSGNNNNNNNVNNQNRNRSSNLTAIKGPQWVSLVQIARTNYDLRSVTDQQIEQALIKSKGNIDEAIFSLVADK